MIASSLHMIVALCAGAPISEMQAAGGWAVVDGHGHGAHVDTHRLPQPPPQPRVGIVLMVRLHSDGRATPAEPGESMNLLIERFTGSGIPVFVNSQPTREWLESGDTDFAVI